MCCWCCGSGRGGKGRWQWLAVVCSCFPEAAPGHAALVGMRCARP